VIDLQINDGQRKAAARMCRERNIVVPTFAQMKDPAAVPGPVKKQLRDIGLWDVHPRNLFRITWKNEPVGEGGGFGGINHIVLPPELTGVPAKIVALVGKWFPTGAHKVGATFGCLVPRLVTGQFDPGFQKAVWPSTGNYCRGGAYVAALLGCESIAILPEEMSNERFQWLKKIAGEVIATPGCESNVKEIFDKCRELLATREDVVIFNQFDEFGNHLWHYEVTGPAFAELLASPALDGKRYAGVVLTSGSSGTLGCADYLKELYPGSKIAVGEALQCPTLLRNGFGGHRIEGIGDKHVPWIHNLKNTDMVIAVNDEHTLRLLRLFNEPQGREYLKQAGVPSGLVEELDLLGISSIGNLISAIKFAKYYELGAEDIVFTLFTDSLELYCSRLEELNSERGPYDAEHAARDAELLHGIGTDNMLELSYYDRKRIHNLKYYTWIEQQKKDLDELNAQWYDREYWGGIHGLAGRIDGLISDFNDLIAGG